MSYLGTISSMALLRNKCTMDYEDMSRVGGWGSFPRWTDKGPLSLVERHFHLQEISSW